MNSTYLDGLKHNILKYGERINSLPNDKYLDRSKSKAFADDKINVTEKLKFGPEKVENIVGKEENAGYQHFLLFPQCFKKVSFFKVIKTWDCVVKWCD